MQFDGFKILFSTNRRRTDIIVSISDWYDISNECDIFGMYLYYFCSHSLYGYYRNKYSEEYREFEGKSLEEWYGKKYLKTQGVVGR